MVIYLTLGFRHGSGVPVIIADQSSKPREHLEIWKQARRKRWHAEFARIEMWASNQGRVRWVRLSEKEPVTSNHPSAEIEGVDAQDEIPASSPTHSEPEKAARGKRR